jgi:hypothetical protein
MIRLAISRNANQPKVRDLIVITNIQNNNLSGFSVSDRYDISEHINEFRLLDRQETVDCLTAISNKIYGCANEIMAAAEFTHGGETHEEMVKRVVTNPDYTEEIKIQLLTTLGPRPSESPAFASLKEALDVRRVLMNMDLPISRIQNQETVSLSSGFASVQSSSTGIVGNRHLVAESSNMITEGTIEAVRRARTPF